MLARLLARLQSKPCAYCAGHGTGRATYFLAGYPACRSCYDHFGLGADPERLARVRAYRAERRGLANRLEFLSR